MHRRDLLRLSAAATVTCALGGAVSAARASDTPVQFDFDELVRRAELLADQPYSPPEGSLPDWIAELDYDSYRRIAFNPEKALLGGTKFALQFFHPGYYFKEPVAISLVEDGQERPIEFASDMFVYDGVDATGPMPEGSSFAGFRLHYQLNLTGLMDELMVFLGASYFRLLGSGQQYGLSARGLAIDTASDSGEEFPRFSAFWIERPEPQAQTIRLYALLESQRITGAYSFTVAPGDASAIEVEASLFPRSDIDKLGIAPLTSMFLYGEEGLRHFDDFRPEVHDSDGLLMHNGADEWLWRPLSNASELAVSAFVDTSPLGFGLFQRDARFASYQDLEANYHLRPSYWVEPRGDWGRGHVELVEIPSDEEINDNVVAFWVPEAPVTAGQRIDVAYSMTALDPGRTPHGLARVVETFIASPRVPGATEAPPPGARRIVLDLAGERMSYDAAFIDRIEADVSGQPGQVTLVALRPNPNIDGVRLIFDAIPEAGMAMDLRASLSMDGERLSEVWFYTLHPDA